MELELALANSHSSQEEDNDMSKESASIPSTSARKNKGPQNTGEIRTKQKEDVMIQMFEERRYMYDFSSSDYARSLLHG